MRAACLLFVLFVGCGARSSMALDEGAAFAAGIPTALYTKDDRGCAKLQPITSAASEMASKQFGEAIAVVELFYQDECTGAGGQHILAREIDGFRSFWIGSHTCPSFGFPQPASPRFGVVRCKQTAALFHISPDVCIGFPDRPPGASTDVTTRATAVFDTLASARSFAASLTP